MASVLSVLRRWWRLLVWLPGRPPKPTPPVYFVPLIPSDTPAVRRYLLERYGAELHPKIRFQLLAKEHRSNQRLALSLKKARRLAH